MLGAILACLAIFGCGGATAATEPAALPAPAAFAISYERGGGLIGSTESLVVTPGRKAVARSSGTRAGDRTVRFQIGRGRVIALQKGLRAAHFGSLEDDTPATCADCFYYSIRYRGHSVELIETEVPPALQKVLGELSSVISARTIPPNV